MDCAMPHARVAHRLNAEIDMTIKDVAGNTSTVLGTMLGFLTIVSLVQRALSVGLAPLAFQVVEYYRWFSLEVKTWLIDWWWSGLFEFSVTPLQFDIFVLWAVSLSLAYRGRINSRLLLWNGAKDEPWPHRRRAALQTLAWAPIAPIGLLAFVAEEVDEMIKWWTEDKRQSRRKGRTEFVNLRREWNAHKRRMHALAIIIALAPALMAIVFFAWNAWELTPS